MGGHTGEMPCEDRGRGDAATIQGTPGTAGRAGDRGGKEGASPDPSESIPSTTICS